MIMRDKIGIVVGQGQYAKWFIDNGFKHFRVNAMWTTRDADGDSYLQPLLYAIKAAGGSVLADVYGLPARLDASQPLINRWSWPSIATFKDEFTQQMQDDLYNFLLKWKGYVDVVSASCEVNIANVWKDPVTGKARGMHDYIDKVIIPLKKVCKEFNKPLLGGSPTLRGDNDRTFQEAIRDFETLQQRSFGTVNHLDFHAYRTRADQVIRDVKTCLDITKPTSPVWISEGMGFNGKDCFTPGEKVANWFKYRFKADRGYSAEQKQLRCYKQWLPYLRTETRIRRAYHFGDFTGTADSLLIDGRPSLAALFMKEALDWL